MHKFRLILEFTDLEDLKAYLCGLRRDRQDLNARRVDVLDGDLAKVKNAYIARKESHIPESLRLIKNRKP